MKHVVVVGNGAIGMMCAIRAAQALPDARVTIVGEQSRRFSASTAAGAMMNVYGEVEALPDSQQVFSDKLLELGRVASNKWRDFLSSTRGETVITAQDTCVVLQKDSFDFETRNFETMAETASEEGVGSFEDPASLEYFAGSRTANFDAVLRLKGEFSVDSAALFGHLSKITKALKIRELNAVAKKIHVSPASVELEDTSILSADFVIVAAGAATEGLFDFELGILRMFQGVGTALVAEKVPASLAVPKEVLRTVNRGGAQCGVHLVPLQSNSLYVGAGNRVTPVGEPSIRFETVSYLLRAVESEFIGRAAGYLLEGQIRVGLRPRSLDGFPMIGPLSSHENVFVATGTNRAGLTWAPEIADMAVSWLNGRPAPSHLDGWNPDRRSLLENNHEDLISHYVDSRLGAGLEHGIVESSQEGISRSRMELEKVARDFTDPTSGRGVPPGTHPDNWAASIGAEVAVRP